MKIFRAVLVAFIFAFVAVPARAQQSAPNWTFNYVPTPAEWSFWFGKKVDFAGALPCIVTGCTFTGPISTTATSAPVDTAGQTSMTGTIAIPTLTGLGQGLMYNSTGSGLILQGKGSSLDVTIRNSAGLNALSVPDGTVNVIAVGTLTTGSIAQAVNGSLNLNGSVSGSAIIGVNSTGVLSLGSNVALQSINFTDAGNGVAFVISNAGGTIANRLVATPTQTGSAPTLSANGSDTNIGINVNPKGTGKANIAGGSPPTLTAGCNGAGSAVSGNDNHGTITGQTTAATTCTLTFSAAFVSTPDCVMTGLSSPLTGAVTVSTASIIVNFASTANYKWSFHCFGT